MTESKIARGLMWLGAGVGLASIVVWGLEVRMLNFPDWLVRVAMIKLAFIASAGLLAGGALVGRHAKRSIEAERQDLLPREPAEPIDQTHARHREAVIRDQRRPD